MHIESSVDPLPQNANETVSDIQEIKQPAAQQTDGEQGGEHQEVAVAKPEVAPISSPSAPVPRPPPPRGSFSDAPTSPRPPPPKPPTNPKPISQEPPTSPRSVTSTEPANPPTPSRPMPPAGRPSSSFGPPPSRPMPTSTSASSTPPVAIRDLWMSSAREEDEAEAGGSEDEGDGEEAEEDDEEEEEEEAEEDDEDGPVDRQGRPVRSAADVKKKRGGGGGGQPAVASEPVAPFAFAPLTTLSFSAGVEKPKSSTSKLSEPSQESKTASSFADTFGASLSNFEFGGGNIFTVASTAVADGNTRPHTSSLSQNNTSASSVSTSTSTTSTSKPLPKVGDNSKEVKEAKYDGDDDDEKSGPVDRNGRPTRAATDIKKKRTPGGRGGDENKVAESDPASTLPFIFAPMHLRSSEGFAAGVDTANTKTSANDNNLSSSHSVGSTTTTKKSQKKLRSPVALPSTSSSSSSYSSGGESSISFSDAAAVSFGSFSFTSSSTSSDFISPFAFRTNNDYDTSPFGQSNEHKVGVASVASAANATPTTTTSQTNTDETNLVKDSKTEHKAEGGVTIIAGGSTNEPAEALVSPRRPPGPPPPVPSSPTLVPLVNLPPTSKPDTSTGSDPLPNFRNLSLSSKPEGDAELPQKTQV